MKNKQLYEGAAFLVYMFQKKESGSLHITIEIKIYGYNL
jgi:hypothetical protein